MARVWPPCLVVALFVACLPLSAQTLHVNVVYVLLDNTQIQTYDVDAQTGMPTHVGQDITIPEIVKLVPSPNDHFLYVLGFDEARNAHIWTYATDPTGAPQSPPIQIVDASNVFDFQIHPDNKLAFASEVHFNQQDGTIVAPNSAISRSFQDGVAQQKLESHCSILAAQRPLRSGYLLRGLVPVPRIQLRPL